MDINTLEVIIGNNVAKYRNVAGLTQAQLADKVGISTAFISRVERGQKMMKVSTLSAVANVLNVSCDALLSDSVPSAQFENIKKLLSDQPEEYIESIEKLIRICIDQFEPKKKNPIV